MSKSIQESHWWICINPLGVGYPLFSGGYVGGVACCAQREDAFDAALDEWLHLLSLVEHKKLKKKWFFLLLLHCTPNKFEFVIDWKLGVWCKLIWSRTVAFLAFKMYQRLGTVFRVEDTQAQEDESIIASTGKCSKTLQCFSHFVFLQKTHFWGGTK